MNHSQFLLFLDAPTGVHQIIATNMIKGIAPFKLSSSTIEIPSELNAKGAKAIIMLHNGQSLLTKDTFEELANALFKDSVLTAPEDCVLESEFVMGEFKIGNLQTEIKEKSPLQVVTASEVVKDQPVSANELLKH